ncbi:hypothetical protein CAFE_11730 [Caprobacter fermentans]|uniref:Uncharacterized protein n=1 Tax=Caproicibacter fermentans TaxID=2576756 RepID=A0A6N8HYS3_9FIRM|nr:hypothetical protein [Caproicibacter fermentans]MVB10483.1 hypothetical protein [Caproicibacter fermentans]OCN00741.1 hypothetical protein A7X67_08165 [Clostridium sp. W14A]QNK41682.1 hypothetical protein HCR03_05360 [Caproicibacter fermentans]
MTNKEKYKQAFSAIHASDDFSLEVEKMERTKKQHKFKTMISFVAVCVMIVGSATAAYAADVGGIQRTIQLWIHGDQTEATLQFDGNGNYSMDYTDGEGNVKHQAGGGVAFSPDGTEIPASEEELTEQLTAPDVEYEDDGSVWVYWLDQKVAITDKFDNGVCYVKLESGKETLYMTVKYQNGYSTSPHKYPNPSEFN